MPRFRVNAVEHDQLSGVVLAQHHNPHGAFVDDGGLTVFCLPGWGFRARDSTTLVVDELYYVPIFVERAEVFDRIGVHVLTAVALSVVRLGIYAASFDADGLLTPGALVLDAGTVDSTSTGDKLITINETFEAGYHFLAFSSAHAVALSRPGDEIMSPTLTSYMQATIHAVGRNIPHVTVVDGAAALPSPATAPDDLETVLFACPILRQT